MRPLTPFSRSIFRTILAICLTVALLLGSTPYHGLAKPTWTITVNSPGDAHDTAPGTLPCDIGGGLCSLRAAIETVNSAGGAATILINDSITTITVSAMLDLTASNVTINGSHTSGPHTFIQGSVSAFQGLLRIEGDSNIIQNFTIANSTWDGIQIGDFIGVGGAGSSNEITNVTFLGNSKAGVYISGSSGGGHNNVIHHSVMGDDGTSSTCQTGNRNGFGVYLNNSASYNDIHHSVIACSTYEGIAIMGTGTDYTNVYSNQVGVRGSVRLGNTTSGVYIENGAHTTIQSNTISGNLQHGIFLNPASNTIIKTNSIGMSQTAPTVGNSGDGIRIALNAATPSEFNDIGNNSDPTARNLIVGNNGNGIHIISCSYNRIYGSMISFNGMAGIMIEGGGKNDIGNDDPAIPQYIGANTLQGIHVIDSASFTIGSNNFIGANSEGMALGNGGTGIALENTSATWIRPGNVSYNGGAGITLTGSSATNNSILPNIISGNSGLPIDLGNDGATPNGVHSPPGPNNWLPYPIITISTALQVTGNTCSSCVVIAFLASGNPAQAHGGGDQSATVRTTANPAGIFVLNLPPNQPISYWSLISCDGACDGYHYFNTSEMSPRPETYLPITRH